MKKYIPYILILIAFFAGQLLGTQDKSGEELLKQKFEQERKKDRDRIHDLLARLAIKEGQAIALERKMAKRMAEKDSALKAERMASTHYRKLNEQINLSLTGIPELDSLRAALRGTLHPD